MICRALAIPLIYSNCCFWSIVCFQLISKYYCLYCRLKCILYLKFEQELWHMKPQLCSWGVEKAKVHLKRFFQLKQYCLDHYKVIARNTCPIFHHALHAKVVLCYKYCKNDWMNMKFRRKLPMTILNELEIFQFFQNSKCILHWPKVCYIQV